MGASQDIRTKGTAYLDYARIATFQRVFMSKLDRLKASLGKWACHRLFRFVIYEYGQDLRVSKYVEQLLHLTCLCSRASFCSLGSEAVESNALENLFASSIDCNNVEHMSIGYATNFKFV